MAIDRVARKLVAILAIDMVSYSRHMETDEAATIARMRVHRQQLIDPVLREHNGRIVKTTGDGLLVEFGSVVDAVESAVLIQRGVADAEADMPREHRIQYRAGINIGDIVIDGDDIFGDGVNIAARMEALAEPGGIS
ncbi:adenylate/guanylate cyclase domain-containing protein, partial [Rhodococcus baikonurensis]